MFTCVNVCVCEYSRLYRPKQQTITQYVFKTAKRFFRKIFRSFMSSSSSSSTSSSSFLSEVCVGPNKGKKMNFEYFSIRLLISEYIYLYLQHIIQPVIQHRPKYLVYTLFLTNFMCTCVCVFLCMHTYCCCSEVIKIMDIKKITTTTVNSTFILNWKISTQFTILIIFSFHITVVVHSKYIHTQTPKSK